MSSNSYNSQIGEQVMEINQVLNELLVELFRDINTLEEHAVRKEEKWVRLQLKLVRSKG